MEYRVIVYEPKLSHSLQSEGIYCNKEDAEEEFEYLREEVNEFKHYKIALEKVDCPYLSRVIVCETLKKIEK